MPTDPQTVGQYDTSDLIEVLREVEDIMTNVDYNDIVWAGDMNVERNSYFSTIMKSFVERTGFCPCGVITRLTLLTYTQTTNLWPRLTTF